MDDTPPLPWIAPPVLAPLMSVTSNIFLMPTIVFIDFDNVITDVRSNQ